MMHLLLVERVYELEAMSDHKALRDMELLKAELLATVSHELRSSLASIKGYAATLLRHERRISREERHEFLLAIKEASDRLAAVIDLCWLLRTTVQKKREMCQEHHEGTTLSCWIPEPSPEKGEGLISSDPFGFAASSVRQAKP
jgi:K+-sensing histidine kinase KdpD